MSKKGSMTIPFDRVLKDLLKWFEKSKGDFLIIGGMAVSLLARARTTKDIDAMGMLDESQREDFLALGGLLGFIPRIKNPLDFVKKQRVLLMQHQKSGLDIDISFGLLPFEEETLKHVPLRRWTRLRGLM